jgi:hypothetical protein
VKRSGFRDERELRAFVPHDSTGATRPAYRGKSLFVDLSSLIVDVWVAPSSPDWFKGMVEEELKKYGHGGIPVKRRG